MARPNEKTTHTLLRLPILRLQMLRRQQRCSQHTPQRNPARQIQHGIHIPLPARRRTLPIQPLRNQRTHNPKQPAPKARHAARRAAYGRGKRLGCPAVQHGVEHALEKVLHGEEAQVLGDRVNCRKQNDADAH